MSGREWKPGDVGTFAGETVIFADDRVFYWATTGLAVHRQAEAQDEARPLVVIDSEDSEMVERLILNLPDAEDWLFVADGEVCEGIREPFQEALRSLIDPPKPPKPEEPQGLGAVVEDADGELWVRTNADRLPWATSGRTEEGNRFTDARSYSEIAAVRVLSEGVQAGESK